MRYVIVVVMALMAHVSGLSAAIHDLTNLPTNTMVVITSDTNPSLPWTYGTVVTVPAQAGDTLRIAPGTYHQLVFWNLRGTAAQPIRVVNGNGRVTVRSSTGWGAVVLYNCRHLRLTGTGSAAHEYGFLAGTTRNGAHTVQVLGDAGQLEIDHVEVDSAGFAGFNVKNETKPGGVYNRGSYVMRDINLHHNFAHDTSGEGFYLGHTFYNGIDTNKDGTIEYPHYIENLTVEYNRTLRTGAEGIQVGSTRSGLVMRFNRVEQAGIAPFDSFQNNGIQVGMSAGLVLGNVVSDAAGNGIIVLGQGDNRLIANVVVRAGSNGFFVDERLSSAESIARGGAPVGPGWTLCNNTVVDSGEAGMRLYGDLVPVNVLRNNLFIGGTSAVSLLSQAVTIDETATVHHASAAVAGFVNAASDDYRPRADSSLVDAGVGLGGLTGAPWSDAVGTARPVGGAIDVGAYERLNVKRVVRMTSPSGAAWEHRSGYGASAVMTGNGSFVDLDPTVMHRFWYMPTSEN
ncbi:MAG: hypothetical protein PF961_08515 [Planctomycetota bacterium]|jgi:hypothetical protein|nr:hypothetical protein [Planctomycetota bacterium]